MGGKRKKRGGGGGIRKTSLGEFERNIEWGVSASLKRKKKKEEPERIGETLKMGEEDQKFQQKAGSICGFMDTHS